MKNRTEKYVHTCTEREHTAKIDIVIVWLFFFHWMVESSCSSSTWISSIWNVDNNGQLGCPINCEFCTLFATCTKKCMVSANTHKPYEISTNRTAFLQKSKNQHAMRFLIWSRNKLKHMDFYRDSCYYCDGIVHTCLWIISVKKVTVLL